MHKLGNGSMTANDKRNEIKAVLTARRNLYNAGVALLECDNVYASNIKFALERLTFSSHTVEHTSFGKVKRKQQKSSIHAGLRRDGSRSDTSLSDGQRPEITIA